MKTIHRKKDTKEQTNKNSTLERIVLYPKKIPHENFALSFIGADLNSNFNEQKHEDKYNKQQDRMSVK